MGDLTDMTNERELHEDEDECNCSNYCFREGVHLPGCHLHSSNLKQPPKDVEIAAAVDGYAEGYLEGYKAALRLYAWWKDGVQYVGSGNRTLKEVLEELEKGDS